MLKRLLVATAALSLLTLAACGDDTDDSKAGSQTSESATSSPEESPADDSSTTLDVPEGDEDPDGGFDAGADCVYSPAGPAAREVDPPPATPVHDGEVKATISTTAGELPLVLDAGHAPCTVNSFVSLAEQGFYDDTPCPRLANSPGFVLLQCGDPSGTGSGGPGYNVPDEYAADESYPAGTLAMANAGVPDSGGSQFFICIEDTQLPPSYTAFGQVDAKGIKALAKVAEAGDDGSHPAGGGKPNIAVDITKVTIDS